jgi:hypothetical protein
MKATAINMTFLLLMFVEPCDLGSGADAGQVAAGPQAVSCSARYSLEARSSFSSSGCMPNVLRSSCS